MVSVLQTIDTNHEDIIHDAQLDFYGTMLATASSDCSVKVLSIKDKKQQLLADLKGHQGPVWGVAWSHPIFGSLLASCSYDKTVIIWQQSNGKWSKLYVHQVHESSVNSVCWAPHELGLMLACASSDGTISILESAQNGEWIVSIIPDAHMLGVNGVSWAPVHNFHTLLSPNTDNARLPKRLVSGGCDNLIKIWSEETSSGSPRWHETERLDGHQDWVRDVAWAPALTDQREHIASCGQDGKVLLWQRFPNVQGGTQWHQIVIHTYPDIVWHVSWNLTGNMLAVSGADNTITLWKENLQGRWVALSQVQRGPTATANVSLPQMGMQPKPVAQKSQPPPVQVPQQQQPQPPQQEFAPMAANPIMMTPAMPPGAGQQMQYQGMPPMNFQYPGYMPGQNPSGIVR